MATAQMGTVFRCIRNLCANQRASEETDGALLRAFLIRTDQTAFEALVRRHGPMVLRVCLRILGNSHDAEDAFQATFLVLARRATSIRKRESLASWLHGVAHRMATNARRAAARRHRHESQANPTQPCDAALSAALQELHLLVDEEIGRLPESLREPFVCCCLENNTCATAARQLGLQEGTVWNRLGRARKLLQERLSRRGVTLSVGLVAALLGQNAASACVSAPLVGSTAKAATLIAAGHAAAPGLVSSKVAALTEGVLKAMFLTKVKTTAVVVLAVVLVGTGTGTLTYHALAAGQRGGAPTVPTGQAPAVVDAAQIRKLIDDLGSATFADRERAAKELDKIGAPALDALRQAARDNDLERKRRAEELVQKIETRNLEASLLAPKRVHLVYKDSPLAEAVADFKKQSGYELTLSDPEDKLKGRTITLDTGDVTFWQALDQFCRKAGLVESPPQRAKAEGELPPSYPRNPGLPANQPQPAEAAPPLPVVPRNPGLPANQPQPAEAAPPLPVVPRNPGLPANPPQPSAQPLGAGMEGNGIILADGKSIPMATDDSTSVRVRAIVPVRIADGSEIVLTMQITPEPKLRGVKIDAVRIKRAIDNRGQSLEPVLRDNDVARLPVVQEPLPVLSYPPNPSGRAGPARPDPSLVRLKTGPTAATSLSELSGTISLRVVQGPGAASKDVTLDVPFTLKNISLP